MQPLQLPWPQETRGKKHKHAGVLGTPAAAVVALNVTFEDNSTGAWVVGAPSWVVGAPSWRQFVNTCCRQQDVMQWDPGSELITAVD